MLHEVWGLRIDLVLFVAATHSDDKRTVVSEYAYFATVITLIPAHLVERILCVEPGPNQWYHRKEALCVASGFCLLFLAYSTSLHLNLAGLSRKSPEKMSRAMIRGA